MENSKVSPGGITIVNPDKSVQGKVVESSLSSINIGDNVIFSKHAGERLNVEDKDLLILNEEDVIAILDKKKKV